MSQAQVDPVHITNISQPSQPNKWPIPNDKGHERFHVFIYNDKGFMFFSMCRGSRWTTMRNTITSLYQPSHLSNLVPTMQSYIESATQNLSSSEEEYVSFSTLSLSLATDIIGQAAFGVDFSLSKQETPDNSTNQSKTMKEISSFIKEHIYSTTSLKMDLSASFSIVLGLVLPILQEPVRQILRWVPGTADYKIYQTNKNLSYRLDKIVARRIEDQNRGSKDFLSAILSSRDAGVAADVTQDYISALAYEHLLAGSATTSFTLSSVLYLVSGHPQVEKMLIEEIDRFGPHDLRPNADDLQCKFPYLDQVCHTYLVLVLLFLFLYFCKFHQVC